MAAPPAGKGTERGRNRQGKAQSETEQFIGALLSYATVEAAAQAVGIGNVTAWRLHTKGGCL
jgi:hypothetical protein